MGNGSSGNPFENVSWNKPFGNSTASTVVGGNGGVDSILNNVSMTNPIGKDSELAGATGHKDTLLTSTGVDKASGQQGTGNPGAPPGAGAGLPSFATPPAPASAPTSYAPMVANRMGTLPSYRNNSAEEAFKNSYMNSLKPNYGQTFQAEANPYKAATVSTSKGA